MEPRESIFKSALRAFFKTFSVILGVFVSFILLFVFSMMSPKEIHMESKTSLTILPDLEGRKMLLPTNTPAILRINIHGVIGTDTLNADIVETQLVESRSGILGSNRVKGILLHFNTPGGGVTDSNTIYELLMHYKQKYQVPVFAYVNGLCASGGMYIASAADKIYSSPVSIIGSVGVLIGPFFNIKDLLQRFGVEPQVITEGKNKDMMSPFRTWKPGEEVPLKNILSYFYERFVSIVSKARPKLTKNILTQELGANVFEAKTAEQLGYIDQGNSSYEETLSELLKAANIDPTSSYQVVELSPKKSWLRLALSSSPLFTGKIQHQLFSHPAQEVKDPVLYLYEPPNLSPPWMKST